MRYKKRGEIAVFLAMLLGVMSLFIMTITMQIKRNVCKSDVTIAMDNAIRSCFSEYNQELFQKYGLMCIDTSYKGDLRSTKELINHLAMYMEENLRNSSTYNLGQISITDISISDMKVVADDIDSIIDNLRDNPTVKEMIKEKYDDMRGDEEVDDVEVITDEDIIEIINQDICNNGSPCFSLEDCVTYLEIKAEVTNGEDFNLIISRSYGY